MELSQDPANEHDEVSGALIVIDAERFLQDCMVEALRPAFPRMTIIGLSSESGLDRAAARASDKDRVVLILRSGWDLASPQLTCRIKALAHSLPKAALVLIARFPDAGSIQTAVDMGADGLIPETASLRVATAAIQIVVAGGTCFPGPLLPLARGLNHYVEPEACARDDADPGNSGLQGSDPPRKGAEISFSPREWEVLIALGKGRSNKAIAFELQLSENTVKAYISQIMRKLRATNRTQAAIFAQKFKAGEERTH